MIETGINEHGISFTIKPIMGNNGIAWYEVTLGDSLPFECSTQESARDIAYNVYKPDRVS